MGVHIYKKGMKKISITLAGILLCSLVLNVTIFNEEFSVATITGADRKLPIYSVATTEKKIAISFDAAWGDDHTKPILDILDQYKVKTTFFLVEFWAKKFPEDVKMIHDRGHEIGNHSSTHPDMANLSAEEITKELMGAEENIKAITGEKPTVFRPPFGSYNNNLMETCEKNGYQVIQWSVETLDLKYNF